MNVSSLLPRLFVELLTFIYFRSTLRIKNTNHIRIFGYIIAILFVRDILYTLLQNDHIMALSDILVVSVYLIWLRSYTGKRRVDIYYFILNALFILFVGSNIFLHITSFPRFFIHLWIFVDIIYLFSFLAHVTEYNTRDPEMILQTRLTNTDGVVEAMNPEGDQYSLKVFMDVIVKNSNLPLGGLIKNIKMDLKQFVGNAKLHDDQTVLLLKCN